MVPKQKIYHLKSYFADFARLTMLNAFQLRSWLHNAAMMLAYGNGWLTEGRKRKKTKEL